MGVNYYFISSPLHLLFSANVALTRPSDSHCAILVPRPGQPFSPFESVLRQDQTIFDQLLSFETGMRNSKRAERRRRMQVIAQKLREQAADRIHTGSDRKLEFQYAMHLARGMIPSVQGVYVDDGMGTYTGHKSANKLAHRYFDPLIKKLVYGHWWHNPLTIGSSRWIDEIRVAYPDLVHESLAAKPAIGIDQTLFKHPALTGLCESLLAANQVDVGLLGQLDCVIVLTHESFYDEPVEHIRSLIESVHQAMPDAQLALKPHPRSEMIATFQAQFSDVAILDAHTAMEVMLPLIPAQCVMIGDVSSALLTTRWFRQQSPLYAVSLKSSEIGAQAGDLYRLFDHLQITRVGLGELSETLNKR